MSSRRAPATLGKRFMNEARLPSDLLSVDVGAPHDNKENRFSDFWLACPR